MPSVEGDRWASGVASFDAALGGGMAYGRVHEIYAAEGGDGASATGFAVAIVTAMNEAGQTVFWLRSLRDIRQTGLISGQWLG